MTDQPSYIGFLIDWTIQLFGTVATYTIVTASASIFIGFFLYITGIVKDMKQRIERNFDIETPKPSDLTEKWSIYVQEIRFHNEIIGYATIYIFVSSKFIFIISAMIGGD